MLNIYAGIVSGVCVVLVWFFILAIIEHVATDKKHKEQVEELKSQLEELESQLEEKERYGNG